ncbi:MAG TPA: hypothetical protein VEX39_05470 [Thermoleophilaceae bacterium]|nr:hypothetical protein [Thermoleophilaceae bacterium]
MRRGLAWSLLSLAAGLAAASPAQGAVTVGETATSLNEACDGANNNTVQLAVAPGHNSFAAPSAGVITSWSHNARSTSDGTVLKLKVYRAQAGGNFLAVGQSDFRDVSDAGPRTFPTRIAVAAGDMLGLGLGANAATHPASCFQPNGQAGDVYRNRVGDLVTGTVGTFPGGPFNVRANVSARLEPDRDCDGLGDESQDTAGGACGGGGGGTPNGPTGGPKDATKPKLRKKKAKAASSRTSVSLVVTPNEACTLRAGATVSVGNTAARKPIRLRSVKKNARAGKATKLTLKVRRKDRARLRRALRRKSRKVKITVRATDAAGNVTRTSSSAKFKRL